MAEHYKPKSFGRVAWPIMAPAIALGGVLSVLVWRHLKPRGRTMVTKPVTPGTDEYRESRRKVSFEPTDWPVGTVALIYVGVFVLLVISPLVLILGYPNTLPDVGRTLRINPPGPRLQTDPDSDLQRFRDEQEKRLNSYSWIDKQKGTVHIPIESAMKKLVNNGIPDFPKEQQ
jgi:hypothetical protein